MTPKDKAIELCDKFDDITNSTLCAAKRCALIAVDEIINSSPSLPILSDDGTYGSDIEESTKYWQQVKQEIENL